MRSVKLIVGSLLFVALTLSCLDNITGQRVKGNGNVITKKREVQPFNKIQIEGIFNVFLRQGEREEVTVEADSNIEPHVIVRSKDGTLLLSWEEEVNISKSTQLSVYVTLRDLEDLSIEGIGKVETSTPLKLEELKLSISGVGKTDLALELGKLVANIDAVGKVKLSGFADNASIEASGVGALDAMDFECKRLILENSGIGKVTVNATQFLHIESDGIGKVRYKGNPEIKEITAGGIGKVQEL